ncbi:MAG TPA: ferrochelatase [bacterium]|nr:ferrochelatase [bacterium]
MYARQASRGESGPLWAGGDGERGPFDAVLLIAYGGPDGPEDVRPYLAGILKGRRVPPGRLEEVARHYDLFGGRSPLTALTRRQAAALHEALAAQGRRLGVYVGMRNWHPYLHETIAAMRDAGVQRAIGIVMAPHRSYASWEQYQENVADARRHVGRDAPAVEYVGPWSDRPGFITAQADRVEAVLRPLPERERDAATLVFTAHSIPVAMAERSDYAREVEISARLVAARLGHPRWQVAYQSRSGDPREPWLEPDVNDVLRELAERRVRAVVTVPIGFVSDHIEVLYDLDTEARRTAADLGIAYHRAGTVMDHPAFIEMLAALVAAASAERT